MLVTADQLAVYGIDSSLWFARRTGAGEPISRDQYFINYPNKLQAGIYCAIGDDEKGWELEQYNGTNWLIVAPDESYRLVITSNGLKALTNTVIGGYRLTISGVKIIDQVVINPSIPFIDWTDETFLSHGDVKFSIGTLNAAHSAENLPQVLSWRYNSASGGLQYCLNLPPEGIGSRTDNDEEVWNIGTIGLYIKDNDGANDVLFAVASLPSPITKYSKNVGRIGNRLKLFFNTVLSNLGFISNLDVMEDGNQSLPEVPNETLLDYPLDNKTRPYNCYLVDNLYGSNIPALAVPRALNSVNYGQYTNDWTFFQPSMNFLGVSEDNFAKEVKNYQFVYWNSDNHRYELAEGRYFTDSPAPNPKMPIGIRIGNNIVYSGEITNLLNSYTYTVELYNGGSGYDINDELDIIVVDNLILKIKVTGSDINSGGVITDFRLIGPSVGNIDVDGDNYVVQSAVYDPRSQLPRNGSGARFRVKSTTMGRATNWNFSAEELNQPVYCDKANPGEPTTTRTDCFLGWITGANSIRLALDLRNEASESVFGTTRYATNLEVKNVVDYPTPANASAVTPQCIYNNFIQKTKPSNSTQAGANWNNPIEVNTCIHFNEMIVGKDINITQDKAAQHWNQVDFWGTSYRAEWADLAEYYEADQIYEPGTLISFGDGEKEITKAQFEADGVISTKPGLQLGSKKNENYLPVALTGRVPVLMDGNSVNYFGDKIYLSRLRPGMASTIKNGKCIGKIIDKNPGTKRLVECVVRIDFNNE